MTTANIKTGITFPQVDLEALTREAMIELAGTLDIPLQLKCKVEQVEVRPHSRLVLVELVLCIEPPEGVDKLVPFRAYIVRAVTSYHTGTFWFEDVLGKIDIPWGQTLTQECANAVFGSWIGKTALAEVYVESFNEESRLCIKNLAKLPQVEKVG